jgi:RNA-directed DNA polymerase
MSRTATPIPLATAEGELREKFFALNTRRDVADLLAVTERELIYVLYRGGKKYQEFEVPKRSGGSRLISAPVGSIKILQKRLNQVLKAIYQPKAPVHGFAVGRSILSNAGKHVHKKLVLNIDLLDFFPSIHFGRVRGLFQSPPYSRPYDVAMVLAQLCIHKKRLPQGAPTSPIVSNMICSGLDSELQRFAAEVGCAYTRYADDITFSTTRTRLPPKLATVQEQSNGVIEVQLGAHLVEILTKHTFFVNDKKVRVRGVGQRREVTGLVVHHGVNVPREFIRSVRGMLHAWERHGLEAAEKELREKHHTKHRRPGSPVLSLEQVASGKLEFVRMIRGAKDPLYTRLWNRFARLTKRPERPVFAQLPPQVLSTLWLVESMDPDDGTSVKTGTAFMLEGRGLVTCDHCLGLEPIRVVRPGLIEEAVVATITHRCKDRDLARLRIDSVSPFTLQVGTTQSVKTGDATIVAGYGNYAAGQQARLTKGHVTGQGVRSGVPVLFSDHRVFSGASGGPVLDESLRVIGILQRGITPDAPSQETTILKIEAVDEVPEWPTPPVPPSDSATAPTNTATD